MRVLTLSALFVYVCVSVCVIVSDVGAWAVDALHTDMAPYSVHIRRAYTGSGIFEGVYFRFRFVARVALKRIKSNLKSMAQRVHRIHPLRFFIIRFALFSLAVGQLCAVVLGILEK